MNRWGTWASRGLAFLLRRTSCDVASSVLWQIAILQSVVLERSVRPTTAQSSPFVTRLEGQRLALRLLSGRSFFGGTPVRPELDIANIIAGPGSYGKLIGQFRTQISTPYTFVRDARNSPVSFIPPHIILSDHVVTRDPASLGKGLRAGRLSVISGRICNIPLLF